MGYLPMDIILSNILPRLPAKSLTRFKCVSKSFLTEISSPKFLKLQQCHAMSSDSNCLLILPASTDEGVYVYDIDSLHTLPSFCPYPNYSHDMLIVATCEDCLLAEGSFDTGLILLNPSTRTYRQIPSDPITGYNKHVRYGMWHHVNEFNDEYKVFSIAIEAYMLGSKTEVIVYNTATNTWKEVESKIGVDTFESYCTPRAPSVVQNHLLHLLFFNLDNGCPGDLIKRIGCFDMKAEQWANDVQLPDVLWDKNGIDFCLHKPYDLGKLNDQLCFMGCNAIESTFDWWVMKEYGVKESWVKLMSLPVPCDRNGELLWGAISCRPLAYRPGSPHELLFIIIGGPHNCILCWYNLIDNEAFEAEFSLPLEDGYNWYFIAYICKGSLLDFPRARSIRVSLPNKEDGEEEDNE